MWLWNHFFVLLPWTFIYFKCMRSKTQSSPYQIGLYNMQTKQYKYLITPTIGLALGLQNKSLQICDLDSHIHVITFLHTAILKHFISRAASQTNVRWSANHDVKRENTTANQKTQRQKRKLLNRKDYVFKIWALLVTMYVLLLKNILMRISRLTCCFISRRKRKGLKRCWQDVIKLYMRNKNHYKLL